MPVFLAFSQITVIVGEVGWPTDGVAVANNSLAEEYNKGVIKKMLSGEGTLKYPNKLLTTFPHKNACLFDFYMKD